MRISGWHPATACVYLPYEDPDFGEEQGTSRRFEVVSAKAPALHFDGGALKVTPAGKVKVLGGDPQHVMRLELPPDAELELTFAADVPRLPSSNANHWFYDGFLPQLLSACPPPGLDPLYYRRPVTARFSGHITLPAGWEFAGPGKTAPAGRVDVDLTGRTVAFALGHSFKAKEFTVEGVPVRLLYHKAGFEELAETVIEMMPALTKMLGPYPFPSLTIVETAELQRHGLPGVIAMNRPRQLIFEHAQKAWLNWQHWILAIQLARQWYGGAVISASPDDDWLIGGIAEFATLEALSKHPQRFNLFNPVRNGSRFLSFDYLQISEVTAATLRHSEPFATLTRPDLTAFDPAPKQNPLLFIKQTFALRQLKSYAGDAPFDGFLRQLTARHEHGFLTPAAFAAELGQLPSPFPPPVREKLTKFLLEWWTHEGWPDFALTDFTSEPLPDGRWAAKVKATQEGGIDFPPLLGVEDAAGRSYATRATPDGEGAWEASLITPDKPESATADPTHETFDEDRFNNRSRWPGLTFFPGGADTLKDDAYTVLWLPYALRRPGEPTTIGVQAALFRYIQNGLLVRLEGTPSQHLGAFSVSHTYEIPKDGLSGTMSVTGDYQDARQAEITLKRSPVFNVDPHLSLEVRARHKGQAGQPETEHSTGVIGAMLQPVGVERTCGYNLGVSYEKAPAALAHGFSYDRVIGSGSFDCLVTQRSSFTIRGFRGSVTGEGTLPQVALFRPTDLGEAHLLLDRTDLDYVRQIGSLGTDVYLPFYLPLPTDTLILERQMRWRLFYDVGRSYDEALVYKSAGFGFVLPLGGDLSGAGSLAITRLSVLGIFYTDVGGVRSKKPSVVFDLTGEL
jgi:hypothetical protein